MITKDMMIDRIEQMIRDGISAAAMAVQAYSEEAKAANVDFVEYREKLDELRTVEILLGHDMGAAEAIRNIALELDTEGVPVLAAGFHKAFHDLSLANGDVMCAPVIGCGDETHYARVILLHVSSCFEAMNEACLSSFYERVECPECEAGPICVFVGRRP